MDFPDDVGKFVPFSFTIVDGGGQPAKVDGDPVLSIDRDDILALSTPLTTNDGSTFAGEFMFAGPNGAANVHLEADALIGDGVETITGDVVVTRVGGKAKGFSFNFGTPHD